MPLIRSARLVAFFTLLAGCTPGARPPGPPATPSRPLSVAARDPEQVNLIAFGDWGGGTGAQREVAAALRGYSDQADAALLLGDNFYVSLKPGAEPRDDAWWTCFDDVYGRIKLTFYAVLGNHDYQVRDGVNKAQSELDRGQDPASQFRMPARWYRIDIPGPNRRVSILMLDSNYTDMWPAEWSEQFAWIRRQLRELHPRDGDRATAPWVICCAHHPILTNGRGHDDEPRLNVDWLPLFNEYRVDFYLAGHNHCLEHVRDRRRSKVSHVVSGGGGKSVYGHLHRHPGKYFGTYGFVHLSLGPEQATVTYVGRRGEPFYSFTRDRRNGTEHDGEVRPDEPFEKGFKEWRR